MTPLLYVAYCGGDDAFECKQTGGEAARALIRHGARIDARDARGRSVHALAKAADHKEVLKVLAEKGTTLPCGLFPAGVVKWVVDLPRSVLPRIPA